MSALKQNKTNAATILQAIAGLLQQARKYVIAELFQLQ